MPKKRYRPEEIIGKLREADVLISQGKKVVEVIKALGVTDVTYYRWRQEYGGMSVPQARRLKELEKENERLRREVARLSAHLRAARQSLGIAPPPAPGQKCEGRKTHRARRLIRRLTKSLPPFKGEERKESGDAVAPATV